MQSFQYTDKSIAVFGETKPWSENLKALGGKFNYNLQGKPGWIFSATKYPQLAEFIAQANAGTIRPAAPQLPQFAPMPMPGAAAGVPAAMPMAPPVRISPSVPLQLNVASGPIPVNPAMMARPLAPLAPLVTPAAMDPAAALARLQQAPIVNRTVAAAVPQQLSFPNRFTAGDNVEYQIVVLTLPVPKVGQKVKLQAGEEEIPLTVTSIEKTDGPLDSIILTKDGSEDTTRGVVLSGVWKIDKMEAPHKLTFL